MDDTGRGTHVRLQQMEEQVERQQVMINAYAARVAHLERISGQIVDIWRVLDKLSPPVPSPAALPEGDFWYRGLPRRIINVMMQNNFHTFDAFWEYRRTNPSYWKTLRNLGKRGWEETEEWLRSRT